MKFYLIDTFDNINRFNKKLNAKSLLSNNHWVNIDNISENKISYIFNKNGELLISKNGKVNKSKWEFLNTGHLLLTIENDCYLFSSGHLDQYVLALKLDGTKEYALFVNETKYGSEINNFDDFINFIEKNYLGKGENNIEKIESENKIHFQIQDEEPIEYIDIDDECPGCHKIGIRNLSICPECGLNLNNNG